MGPLSCEQVHERMWLHLYEELSIEEDNAMEAHLAQCAACAAERESVDGAFSAIELAQDEPPPALLAESRRELWARLERKPSALAAWWSRGWRLAGAVAMLAAAFLAGRYVAADARAASEGATVATRVRGVERDASGDVHLLIEQTRELSVSGRPNEARIRELLLSAAQDPTDAGLRVTSVDLLRRESAAMDVRRALMAALESDPNPGVRLKAIDGLRPFGGDPEVRRSLAQALTTDDNTGVRTQAVDLLVQHQQRDIVGLLQNLMEHEQNDYIRLRSQRALRQMKASVTTF